MTNPEPCPRCQLAGPHADAAACVGALLAVVRMQEQELVWLRARVRAHAQVPA